MTKKLKISQILLDEMSKAMISAYPDEGCGFLLGEVGAFREARRFVACKNIQNELHSKDPLRFSRTAATAYVIDSVEQDKIQKEATSEGLEIIAIVHSHPEHDVYFSKEDKENAAPWGEPLFANLSYIVASIYSGELKGISDFYWDETKKDFFEKKIS